MGFAMLSPEIETLVDFDWLTCLPTNAFFSPPFLGVKASNPICTSIRVNISEDLVPDLVDEGHRRLCSILAQAKVLDLS